ncbi:MAG: hypothetical protein N2Z75_08340, partial [Meiothermus sp.]|nr:hypothetical protein [Meiothermus sp.]
YTDALGLIPAAATPLRFAVPSLRELAVRYHLEPTQATCALCHIGRESTRQLNPFGRDYQTIVRRMLDETVAADSPEARSIFQLNVAQIRQALREVTQDGLDSDDDGFDNDLELLFGFRPGEAESRPNLKPETLLDYRARLRGLAREGRLETLLRSGVRVGQDELSARGTGLISKSSVLAYWGFTPDQTPLVRLERLALYKAALHQ